MKAIKPVLFTIIILLFVLNISNKKAAAIEDNIQQSGLNPEDLASFHNYDRWEGIVKENVLWEGSPEAKTVGTANFRWILDQSLIVGNITQQHFSGGKNLLTWEAFYLAGWDPAAKQYRVLIVDKNSWGAALHATIEGDQFIMVSPAYEREGSVRVEKGTVRIISDKEIKWTKEISDNDGPWEVTEWFIAQRNTSFPTTEE